MQKELNLKYKQTCIMDRMIMPDNNDWIYELIDKCQNEDYVRRFKKLNK